MFIIGVSDSSCRVCCESEKVLSDLDDLNKNGTLTYSQEVELDSKGKEVDPNKKVSKKKRKKHTWVTKEYKIPVVRIDTADKHETEAWSKLQGMQFHTVP